MERDAWATHLERVRHTAIRLGPSSSLRNPRKPRKKDVNRSDCFFMDDESIT